MVRKHKTDLRTRLAVLHQELSGRDDGQGMLPMVAAVVGGVSKSTVHRWINAQTLAPETLDRIERGIRILVDRALAEIDHDTTECAERRAAILEVA